MTLETEIQKGGVSVPLKVSTKKRGEEYFAAITNPFAITGCGKTESEAETRAVKGVEMLLESYAQVKDLVPYLRIKGVPYTSVN